MTATVVIRVELLAQEDQNMPDEVGRESGAGERERKDRAL